jgi:hypothetical protein
MKKISLMFQSLYLINTQLISNKTLFIVRNPLAKRLGGFLCAVSPIIYGALEKGRAFYYYPLSGWNRKARKLKGATIIS